MQHYIPVTREGLKQAKADLKRLKSEERPRIITSLATARAHGDLSENAEYDAAKEEQAKLEKRIAELEERIKRAQIVETASKDAVVFGAHVKVQEVGFDEVEEYHLVGADESDPGSGRISTASPMGKAFLRKKKGDIVEFVAPNGKIKMKILEFWY